MHLTPILSGFHLKKHWQSIFLSSIGFNAEVVNRNEMDIDELLRKVEPRDLTKFGLIPEFIGRVPVMVSLEQLTKEAMVRILSEPKNALTKQYKKLFVGRFRCRWHLSA